MGFAKVSLDMRKMLLGIAYDFSDGKMMTFLEFAELVVSVLEDAVEPDELMESTKAEAVYDLWKAYAAGQRPWALR
jgi:hypothetical protein